MAAAAPGLGKDKEAAAVPVSLWREEGVAVQNVAKAGETRGGGGFCIVLERCAALSDAQNCY